MQHRGICPKCLQMARLTKHHIFPKKYFKKKHIPVLFLCRTCHDDLERLYPLRKTKKDYYIEIVRLFMS